MISWSKKQNSETKTMSNTPISDKIIKWIYEGHNPETGKEYFERIQREKLGVVGYPNSFISEQEQQTYESNN